MNNFRGSNIVWKGLLVLGMVMASLARPVWANDERVFEKTLASKQKVVVVRHELEEAEKEQAQQRHRDMVKGLPPGETSPMPDHFYLYLFQLAAADGKTNKEIWRMPWAEYDRSPRGC